MAFDIFAYSFVFVFGLIIGSFLNVVIIRLAPQSKRRWWQGRSRCERCKHALTSLDLLPLASYLMLRGKCRHCHKSFSAQYPLIELTCGLLFTLIFWRHFGNISSYEAVALKDGTYCLRDWFLACVCIIVFAYDLKHMLILDAVVIPACIIVLLFNVFLGIGALDIILGGCIGFGFFAIQFFVSRGRWIGGGDMRLGAFMGLALGWKLLLLSLFLSYFIGAAVGIALIMLAKNRFNDRIAFGTFLTAGMMYAVLFGESTLEWYFRFIF